MATIIAIIIIIIVICTTNITAPARCRRMQQVDTAAAGRGTALVGFSECVNACKLKPFYKI